MRISFIKSMFTALGFFVLFSAALNASAARTTIPAPVGSDSFGRNIVTLPNGNFIVADPDFDENSINNIGAVHLYNGATLARISTLKGATENDFVGNAITILPNGNFVVRTALFNGGSTVDVGAVTFCSGTTGCNGTISTSNSLLGSSTNDSIGGSIVILSSNDYVVVSTIWDNGAVANAGAVTFCNGTTGCTGAVSAVNSTVGSTVDDSVGSNGITRLGGSNYVINSLNWDNGAAANAGAVTFCNGGTSVCLGAVSPSNSLVGSTASDSVGSGGVTRLDGLSYVVSSPNWDNGTAVNVGAITLRVSPFVTSGAVSAANSLVGTIAGDLNGSAVTPLLNGDYVVSSPQWDNGTLTNAGAVTLCTEGCFGSFGAISPTNSLVGSTTNDAIGTTVTALTNGNYVVGSPNWNNGGVVDAGAATFCSGTTGRTGAVSAANSLIGSTAVDQIGTVTALTNGNYVVSSRLWDNGVTADAGAAIVCSGTLGRTGGITAGNALVGSTPNDFLNSSILPLTNGNYIVSSPNWDNGAAVNAGASTFCSGVNGCTGAVSVANSLVGQSNGDQVGLKSRILPNGNYVISSENWNNGGTVDAGAVTFCSGTTGCAAAVSAANSLVGSTTGDRVGFNSVVLTNGNYIVITQEWDDAGTVDVGAVTFCSGTTGCGGTTVGKTNSLVGSSANNFFGGGGVSALPNGDYVIQSFRATGTVNRDTDGIGFVPVLSYGNGIGGIIGTVNEANSLIGTAEIFNSLEANFAVDPTRRRVILGTGGSNSVVVGSFPTQFDFGIDGRAEIGVFRPSNGGWFTFNLTTGENTGAAFGQAGDVIVPADYDGDMKTDIAVYRGGTWFLQRSALGFTGITFGAASDIPAPADFDGDGRSELAVFRPSTGVWFTLNLANGAVNGLAFGGNGDRPVPADYDGDGRADIAVYRAGAWFIQRSSLGFTAVGFGDGNDRTVQADYDADGKADIAVFRPSTGNWFLLRSTLGFTGLLFGQNGDQPAPADYDGDSRTDLAVVRSGSWFLQRSTAGFTGVAFGASTDLPVSNAYVR